MIQEIEKVISGKKLEIIRGFLEPYLKLSISKIDHIYKVQIQFDYYRKEEWGEINIVEKMNKKELCQMKDAFKELSHQFPIRKVK